MQTPEPSADAAATDAPRVDDLLRRSADGDRAAFSALYDATVPWVHGLAVAMFGRGPTWEPAAAEATARTYVTAWEEAGDAVPDLDEQQAPAERERAVLGWLAVLAHRVMADLRRSSGPDAADPRAPGTSTEAPVPAELTGRIDAPAYTAVRLAWLGGLTDREAARRAEVPVAEARTLMRDGVRALVAAHAADHGRPGPSRGSTPPLGADVAADLDAGRGAELADLSALHALTAEDHTAAFSATQDRGPGELALWRSRVDTGRRAVAWAFRGEVAEPPSGLLEDVLHRLPAQDVGMVLVDEHRAPRPPRDRRRPLKLLLMALLAAAVLAAGVWALWSQFSSTGVQLRVREADDLYTTSEYPARGGGSVQGFLSREENSGFLAVNGMPQLPDGRVYQIWLHPADGSAPASLGTYAPEDFDDPVSFRGLDGFAAVSMTVEPRGGSETPTSEYLLGLDLDPMDHVGPQYGGRPSTG